MHAYIIYVFIFDICVCVYAYTCVYTWVHVCVYVCVCILSVLEWIFEFLSHDLCCCAIECEKSWWFYIEFYINETTWNAQGLHGIRIIQNHICT